MNTQPKNNDFNNIEFSTGDGEGVFGSPNFYPHRRTLSGPEWTKWFGKLVAGKKTLERSKKLYSCVKDTYMEFLTTSKGGTQWGEICQTKLENKHSKGTINRAIALLVDNGFIACANHSYSVGQFSKRYEAGPKSKMILTEKSKMETIAEHNENKEREYYGRYGIDLDSKQKCMCCGLTRTARMFVIDKEYCRLSPTCRQCYHEQPQKCKELYRLSLHSFRKQDDESSMFNIDELEERELLRDFGVV